MLCGEWCSMHTYVCRYYRTLVSNLGNKYKEIYAATAEVLGMTLNYISEHAHTDVGPLHDLITDQLLALLQARDEDKFTVCFHKLAKAYPPLVDRFVCLGGLQSMFVY